MSRDIFIGDRPDAMAPRWRGAFPDLVLADSVGGIDALSDADNVWIVTDLPDWKAQIESASAAGATVVGLSLNPAQEEGLQALEAGARGYLHALATAEVLQQVVTAVRSGGLWVGPELLRLVVRTVSARLSDGRPPNSSLLDSLTPRERQVAMAVVTGASNKEVARSLDITERTVKAHLGVVFEKLGVRDRLQLALRLGNTQTEVETTQ